MGKRTPASRGRIETVKLKKALLFNGSRITKAIIEIDHINHGLDPKTKQLNKTKRSNFSLGDVEMFLMLLDGESIMPSSYKGMLSRFDIRINCPVKGRFFQKEFIMVFDTDYVESDVIYTITLYPGW